MRTCIGHNILGLFSRVLAWILVITSRSHVSGCLSISRQSYTKSSFILENDLKVMRLTEGSENLKMSQASIHNIAPIFYYCYLYCKRVVNSDSFKGGIFFTPGRQRIILNFKRVILSIWGVVTAKVLKCNLGVVLTP